MSPSSKRGPGQQPRPAAQAPVPAKPPPEPSPVDSLAPSPVLEATPVPFGRVGPFAAIAYALVGLVGSTLLPVGKVEPDDPAPVIARQFESQRGRVSAGILLSLLSLFFLLVFVAWLYRWLRRAEGESGWLATLALGGGILLVAMLSVVVLLSIGSTVLEHYGDDPVIARTLLVLQWQAVAVAFIPGAAFIGATSLIGYSRAVLPKWLSYTGLAIALGLLVPPLAFLPFLFSSLWTGMLGVFLLQQARARP